MTKEKNNGPIQLRKLLPVERIMLAIGSVRSVVLHTIVFSLFFLAAAFQVVSLELVLLVLTTVVSLEAIYLAIFIQMAINRNTQSLLDVEEDIEEIQEDVGEIQEGVAEVQEDMDEIQEEILDGQEDLFGNKAPVDSLERGGEVTLGTIKADLARLLEDLETLKESRKD